jgi:hypothetical protein
MRRATFTALAALTAALAVAAGASAAPASRKSTANAWAHAVCSSVGGWEKSIGTRAGALNKLSGTNLPAVKRALVNFLSGVVGDTQTVIAQLDKAGTPSAPNGAAAAKALHSAFVQTKSFYVADLAKAKALPVSPATKLLAGETALGKSIDAQNKRLVTIFGSLKTRYPSKALAKAFKTDPACRAIR